MERCEKRVFQLFKLRKKNHLKHKNQVSNRLFIDSEVFDYEGLYLSFRGEYIKDKVYINFIKKYENLEIFFYI